MVTNPCSTMFFWLADGLFLTILLAPLIRTPAVCKRRHMDSSPALLKLTHRMISTHVLTSNLSCHRSIHIYPRNTCVFSCYDTDTLTVECYPYNMHLTLLLKAATILVVAVRVVLSEQAIVHINKFHASTTFKNRLNTDDRPTLAARANYWKPEQIADDARWTKFVEKGKHLNCLMEASDKGAGWLLKDTRNPPSAASQWTGDLSGKYTYTRLATSNY